MTAGRGGRTLSPSIPHPACPARSAGGRTATRGTEGARRRAGAIPQAGQVVSSMFAESRNDVPA